ncbi:DNA/RNA non-specific endonuclease [Piscirickettsia litoralis]|uniref:Endonuclease n=1 Tax=Piscirickettsia litoralis TaxID=1891921 RepID=A0ABX3A4Z4_9GAMM|nr:DNA/RNA non-specific endonuclease [Piscirickettsia litoralis]ODN43689.1 DNA/RNA endonuclease [Piscirickettsia litoralis]
MKKVPTILTLTAVISFTLSITQAAQGFDCHGFLKNGNPGHVDQYLCREAYTVGYNYQTKQPTWVASKLTGESVNKHIKRKDKFKPDSSIPVQYRAELSDYSHSGYDRGHLMPYASADIDQASANESFLLSNMSPQKSGLNRQGWAALESDVRFWAKYKKEVYVYTGPVFQGKNIKSIGNGVKVPTAFFKIIYAPQQHQAIAFVMPNAQVSKSKVSDYRTNIATIEKLTGMQFLTALPQTERNKLISTTAKMWRVSYS